MTPLEIFSLAYRIAIVDRNYIFCETRSLTPDCNKIFGGHKIDTSWQTCKDICVNFDTEKYDKTNSECDTHALVALWSVFSIQVSCVIFQVPSTEHNWMQLFKDTNNRGMHIPGKKTHQNIQIVSDNLQC